MIKIFSTRLSRFAGDSNIIGTFGGDELNSCNNAIVMPSLDIKKQLNNLSNQFFTVSLSKFYYRFNNMERNSG